MIVLLYGTDKSGSVILQMIRARSSAGRVIPARAKQALAWIEENKVEATLDRNHWLVDFKYEEDATAFKLRFGV